MQTILLKYSEDEIIDLENGSFEKKEEIITLFSQFLDTLDRTKISVISGGVVSGESPTLEIFELDEYLRYVSLSDLLFVDMEKYSNLGVWLKIGSSADVSEPRLLSLINHSKNTASLWTRVYSYIFKRDLFYDFQKVWISDLLEDKMLILTKDSDAEGLLIYYQENEALSGLRSIFKDYVFKLPFTKK